MSAEAEAARVEQSNDIADIVYAEIKRVWPDLHPVLDLRYGIADAIWTAGYRKSRSGVAITSEFLDKYGCGYVIEKTDHGFRYVWRETGEPDDESVWFGTESGAINAAWSDWGQNGARLYMYEWCARLEAAAKGVAL